jgi:hypothetical protein
VATKLNDQEHEEKTMSDHTVMILVSQTGGGKLSAFVKIELAGSMTFSRDERDDLRHIVSTEVGEWLRNIDDERRQATKRKTLASED